MAHPQSLGPQCLAWHQRQQLAQRASRPGRHRRRRLGRGQLGRNSGDRRPSRRALHAEQLRRQQHRTPSERLRRCGGQRGDRQQPERHQQCPGRLAHQCHRHYRCAANRGRRLRRCARRSRWGGRQRHHRTHRCAIHRLGPDRPDRQHRPCRSPAAGPTHRRPEPCRRGHRGQAPNPGQRRRRCGGCRRDGQRLPGATASAGHHRCHEKQLARRLHRLGRHGRRRQRCRHPGRTADLGVASGGPAHPEHVRRQQQRAHRRRLQRRWRGGGERHQLGGFELRARRHELRGHRQHCQVASRA